LAAVAEEEEAVAGEIAEIDTKVLSDQLKFLSEFLQKQGLSFLGVVSPETHEDFEKYQAWLVTGNHGELKYLEQNQKCRRSAKEALSSVQSVIVFGLSYAPEDAWPAPAYERARVAAYARFNDYHSLMKSSAQRAVTEWKKFCKATFEYRVVVDTVPLLERAFARKTGVGFVGKNTCFIHEERGSFLLLGEILMSLPFSLKEKNSNVNCGTCTLCQVECPTGALDQDYQIDSRKCLSYWTIEQRGPIPEEFWPGIGKYWFGCDICQLVCPFNKSAKDNELPELVKPKTYPSLFEVATMSEEEYEKIFGGTPLTRAKRNGLRRNALIAMAVNRDPLLEKAILYSRQDADYPISSTLDQIERFCSLNAAKK